MLGNQVAGADIAVEGHQLLEEAPRPQDRVAAPSVGDRHRDQITAVRRKGLDQPVDQMGIDQRHVAQTNHGAVGIFGHRRDTGFDRARKPAGKIRVAHKPYLEPLQRLLDQLSLVSGDNHHVGCLRRQRLLGRDPHQLLAVELGQ